MKFCRWFIVLPLVLAFYSSAVAASWGRNYFPNVELTNQDGEQVRFFDDLIEGKIVAVNFIFTSCPDSCPLETAQLKKVQDILGDRIGDDIFFYSISIDPEHDQPPILSEYKDRFGAHWDFFTGNEEDITLLRRKLGLYVEEIQDGSGDHNLNMMIGNQATGQWMKRAPTENPYILASQLNGLCPKCPPLSKQSYHKAPELRPMSAGEQLFRTRCSVCHTVDGETRPGALGPDLMGVTGRRDRQWLLGWLQAPDKMIADEDPIAVAMLEEWGNLVMPNMRLNRQEADDLLVYLASMGELREEAAPVADAEPEGDVLAVMDAWVREADARAPANAGYMTLVNVGQEAVSLVKVESPAFGRIEVHEMAVVDGLMRMREVEQLLVPPGGQAKLAPGGKHLMLMEPVRRAEAGQTINMTLSFESGRTQVVAVPVKVK
ncbi:MAG: copper chaperone PCu(A)C [bacterium]